MNLPKPYIQKLQNRKKCKNPNCFDGVLLCQNINCNDTNKYSHGHTHKDCQGTGNELIEFIFPAKELNCNRCNGQGKSRNIICSNCVNGLIWKVGQEIEMPCYRCFEKELELHSHKFKILSLERKKIQELTQEQIIEIEEEYGNLRYDEEIILVRC